jgi:endo-1,4-beta-mannosidase
LLDIARANERAYVPWTLQEYVKKVVLRRNRLNGRLYKDDDTIMAWGLLNEPRCETYKVRMCMLAIM